MLQTDIKNLFYSNYAIKRYILGLLMASDLHSILKVFKPMSVLFIIFQTVTLLIFFSRNNVWGFKVILISGQPSQNDGNPTSFIHISLRV